MKILDGKLVSSTLKQQLKDETSEILKLGYRPPHLAAILAGDNPSSETYVRNKIKACEEVGFNSSLIRFDNTVKKEDLINVIEELNTNSETDGFIVQLPLPKHINEEDIIRFINPEKDADGFHPQNLGRMLRNLPCLLPATPKGILEMINFYQIPTEGKNCVVLGRSLLVGTPVSILLSRKAYPGNCTVSILHSKSKEIEKQTLQADILISAIGIPHFVKKEMVKEGAVVIDVGTNSIPDVTKKSGYRLIGDVDFENVAPKCDWISPVPGGVGLMTVTALLQNTMIAFKKHFGI